MPRMWNILLFPGLFQGSQVPLLHLIQSGQWGDWPSGGRHGESGRRRIYALPHSEHRPSGEIKASWSIREDERVADQQASPGLPLVS